MERTLRTEEKQAHKGTNDGLKTTEGYVLHAGIQKHQKIFIIEMVCLKIRKQDRC